MWAQLITARIKDGTFEQMEEAEKQWEEQVGRGTDSGWVRSFTFRNAKDPNEVYQLVFFESEEKARANETSPQHQAMVQHIVALMAGEPQYVDLTPARESTR